MPLPPLPPGGDPSSCPASAQPWVYGRALGSFLLGADQLAVDQAFGDLDGVQGGALAQIVGNAPQRQPVLDGGVLADAADVSRVLARGLIGRDVAARLALVDHEASRRVAQDVARLVGRDRVLELDVDRLR